MIRIGTSGYNHRDWIGSFYASDLGPARYLARYAEEFEVCELAGAVHRVPEPAEARRILGEAGGRLVFTALAPRRLVASVVAALEEAGSKPLAPVEARGLRVGEAVPRWGGRSRSMPQVGAGFLSSEGGSDEIPGRDFSTMREPPTPLPRGRRTSSGGADREEVQRARAGEPEARPDADRATHVGRGPGSGRGSGSGEGAPARAGIGFGPRQDRDMDALLARLREGLLPYAEAGRFRGVVLPLPRSVPAVEDAFVAIARIADRLDGLGLLVEPRDPSWVGETALGFLRGVGAGLVLADGPDAEGPALGPDRGEPRPLPVRPLAPFAPVTAGVACVRFHGRDAEDRWAGGAARRDYLYSWEELVSWLATLRALANRSRELLIVFNNPWRERAIENARMMRRLVGEGGSARRTRARAGIGGVAVGSEADPEAVHGPPSRHGGSPGPDVVPAPRCAKGPEGDE